MFGKSKKEKKPFVSAVVAAGGVGSRMGSNKLLLELENLPILGHTLLALESSPLIDEIVISAHKDNLVEYGQIAVDLNIKKLKCVVVGGETRSKSVLNGILNTSKKCEYVLIHDGARPFVTEEEIKAVTQKAFTDKAATAATLVKDTIKKFDGEKIVKTLERAKLVQVQTPQVFEVNLIKGALGHIIKENIMVTDDCEALEIMGFKPSIVLTSYDNIKITTVEDMIIGNGILAKRSC